MLGEEQGLRSLLQAKVPPNLLKLMEPLPLQERAEGDRIKINLNNK